jgi:LacI family transcriptional regulator
MAVSIYEVAKKAKVSIATVSKVLNQSAEGRVGAETRARVLSVAQECGYQPNRLARSLVRRSSDTIGLMVSGFQNPFFVAVAEAMEAELFDKGYQVMLDSAPSGSGSYFSHGKLRGWPVDGVVMWAFQGQTTTQYLGPSSTTLPTVYMGYPRDDGSAWVAFDLYGGGRQAAEHLVDLGHKRVTYVTPDPRCEDGIGDPRILAGQDVCRERGLRFDVFAVSGWQFTRAAALETGLQIAAIPRSERPRALICHNDITALGIYHGVRRGGLRVPEDIAIVGFDGIEEGRCEDIPLTTIDSPVDVLAKEAVRILIARMNKDYETSSQQVLVPTRLWVGGTSA